MRFNDMRPNVLFLTICMALLISGCTGHILSGSRTSEVLRTDRFVVVKASAGDTLESLAATYLKDKDRAWQIAAFNEIRALTPGQRVLIPMIPVTPGGLQKNGYQTVPVLRYSDMAENPSRSRTVSARTFQRQLDYLKANGYVTITLDHFHGFLELKDQLPPKAIVISIDTTGAWAREIAFPELQKRGMRAALFIDPQEVEVKGKLTWQQLAELADSGWDIGLYGPEIKAPAGDDARAYLDRLEAGIAGPQKAFQRHLKRSCSYYAYPEGDSNDLTIAMLKKHGYNAAFTRKRGSNPFFADNYKIKRSTVFGQYSLSRFQQNLTTFRSAALQ